VTARSTTVLLCLFLLSPVDAGAQPPNAAIRGTVRDASGNVVGNARIELTHLATNSTRSTSTADDGQFVLSVLPAGRYRLQASLAGFKTYVEHLVLQVGHDVRSDVTLQVGGADERVVVEAATVPLDRDSAATGAVVDNRQVVGLPLDGRNFLELTLLAAGTAPAAEGSAGSVRGDFAFSVSGGREDANAFLLDGVDNVDPKLNNVAVNPPVDAIHEFEVQTSSHEAALGRYSAGQVNVVLKSGSNSLNGTVYGFFRNGAMDARNFFAPPDEPAPDYQRSQFGGSIGGPITPDRLFFFADYEGTRLTEGLTRLTSVPTAAERAGDFSQSLMPAPIDPFTQQPFPGNRIPPFYLNPIGSAIANLYPLPNREAPAANFVSSPNLEDRVDQFDVRLDRPLGGRFELMGRYSFTDRSLYEPFTGPAFSQVPGYGSDLDRRAQNLAISGVSVLTPSLLNEARFGYTRVSAAVNQEGAGTSLNRMVGLPELSENARDWGLSFITVAGLSPLGQEYNNPQAGTTDAFQFTDTLTWSRGRHLVKAGADLRLLRQDAFRDVQARGQLIFTPFAYTGNALADLLLGLPSVTTGAQLDNPQRLRTENLGLFVQDSWAVTSRLTLNAGLRYEITSPPVDADDRATIYDPSTGTLVGVGTEGVPRAGYDTDWNNLAPRLGVAWTADSKGHTVVRGAYGVYYNQSALAPSEGLYFSDPYFHLDIFVPAPGLPPLTLYDPWPASYPFPSPQSGFTFQRDLATPYLQHWSLGVQRQLGPTRNIEVAYVGSKGSSLITGRDLNQPRPSADPINLRPNPRFGDITILESAGHSRYDSLQLSYAERRANQLSLLASYTLGESKDNASGFFPSAGDPNYPQDSQDLEAEYGRSSFDVRHRFSLGFVWDVPMGSGSSGLAEALLRDWQLSGVITLQSGRPFTVALLPDFDNSNTGRANLGFGNNDRPNLVGDATLADPTAERWFDTTAFVIPPFGSFGDAGRNIVEGPGYQNVNMALMKSIRIAADARLQLRLEAFNLFNRTNFNQPDNFLGSATFGQVLSAQSPRRLQLGAKVLF
jgi:hypothetical protein